MNSFQINVPSGPLNKAKERREKKSVSLQIKKIDPENWVSKSCVNQELMVLQNIIKFSLLKMIKINDIMTSYMDNEKNVLPNSRENKIAEMHNNASSVDLMVLIIRFYLFNWKTCLIATNNSVSTFRAVALAQLALLIF